MTIYKAIMESKNGIAVRVDPDRGYVYWDLKGDAYFFINSKINMLPIEFVLDYEDWQPTVPVKTSYAKIQDV